NVAYQNTRRDFYRPGSRVYNENGRASINKNFDPNRRNTMIASNTRTNNSGRSTDSRVINSRNNTVDRTTNTGRINGTSVNRNGNTVRSQSTTTTRSTAPSQNTVRKNPARTVSNQQSVQ